MKRSALCIFLSVVLLTTTGCRQQREQMPTGNAVYYWRTSLHLDATERAFLASSNISKVYCRYFDVVINHAGESPMPNATISFIDTLPANIEVVPTVYITEDCMHQRHEGLATKIVRRILQMNETNDIGGVSEIQIDCDYTARSRQTYYQFLEEVAAAVRASGSLKRLSATIRLHQLGMEAPPVDYGVLMIYNTGDPRKFEERNPILDLRDVQPYLGRLDDYPLPLAAAYPVYQWIRHINNFRLEHTVEAGEILRVKQAVEHARSDLSRAIITYHLDKENINRYKPETYEAIYHH